MIHRKRISSGLPLGDPLGFARRHFDRERALSVPVKRLAENGLVIAALIMGAAGARLLFSPALGFDGPLLIYTLAVAVAAQSSGTVAGLITTCLSALFMHHFAPASDLHTRTALAIFPVVGTCLSLFGGWRKRLESKARRIGYNLEAAQHIANIGSWGRDLDGKLWWSPETYAIFGVAPGTELHADIFFELVHPEDRTKVRTAVEHAIESRNDYDVEHRILRKSDGEVRHVHQRAKVIANGTIHLIGSVQDVTEARRKSDELERTSRVMRLAMEATNSGAWMWTVETDEWVWSKGYCELFALDPGVAPSLELIYSLVHPQDVQRLRANLRDAVEGKISDIQIEFRVQRSDGIHWFERRGRVFRDALKGQTQVVGVTTDVTERKILRGLLPTCAQCKKIRDEHDHWEALETYLSEHSEARFTHGLCPDCTSEWAKASGIQETDAAGSAGG